MKRSLLFPLLVLAAIVVAPQSAFAALTFTVNSSGNAKDANTGDGQCLTSNGFCTLRAAIQQSNASAGKDTIRFAIGSGVKTIIPTSPLPDLLQPVVITGSTQPGSSFGPRIQLDGAKAGSNAYGLIIAGGSSTVRGLAIGRFARGGIWIPQGVGDIVSANYIGTDPTGTLDRGNGFSGVSVSGTNNRIGGPTAADRNLISGNLGDGVSLNVSATGNLIQGNRIGTNAAGTAALANGGSGVGVVAPGNTIGGVVAGAGNLISGNIGSGVLITGDVAFPTVTGDIVQGNLIGVTAGGSGIVANGGNGVTVRTAENITIGGTSAAARNVVSGNQGAGIVVEDVVPDRPGVMIQGNFVGPDAAGSVAIGNGSNGIELRSVSVSVIGGTTSGGRNVISSNGGAGVVITDTAPQPRDPESIKNLVQGNYIGPDATGTTVLGNGEAGVTLDGVLVDRNVIGGTTAAAGNLISGNNRSGIFIHSAFGDAGGGNLIQGNSIGSNAAGTSAMGNGEAGVSIIDGLDDFVGGTSPSARNRIAFNTGDGVAITCAEVPPQCGAHRDRVLRNFIYSNGGLGIDLKDDGVTANDGAGDPDAGPNGLQNFPGLTSASSTASSTTVQGSLQSTASTQFRLEFYSSPTCDGSGNGEGKRFLGAATVSTNGSGNVSFSTTFPLSTPSGQFVTATATGNGSTSEFSVCKPL